MMKIVKWVLKYFFLAMLVVLVLTYWQWFRLAPATPEYKGELIFGITLLAFYGLFTILEKIPNLRPSIFLLIVFCLLLIGYLASGDLLFRGGPSAFDFIGLIVLYFYGFFTALAKPSENEQRASGRTLPSFIAILFLLITPPLYCSFFQPSRPSTHPSIDYLGFIVLGFYCFFIILTRKLSYEHHPSKVLTTVLTGVFLFINGLNTLQMPQLVTSIDCDNKTYQVVYHPDILEPGYSEYTMLIWKGMFDYSFSFLGYQWGFEHSQFTCDRENNIVRFFTGYANVLSNTYGTQNQEYEAEVRDTFNDIEYTIYSYETKNITNYLLTRCRPEQPDTCEFVPVNYSSPSAPSASMMINRETGDVHLLFHSNTGMTYLDLQSNSRKATLITTYTPDDLPEPKRFGKEYRVVSYQIDHAFAYLFYRCDDPGYWLDECDYIPLNYTTPTEQNASLDYDQTTDHVTLSIGGKPVFTYNHPFED